MNVNENWCLCGAESGTAEWWHYTDYHECIYHDYEECGLCAYMRNLLLSGVEGYLFSEATTREEDSIWE